jgi:hypothetical protein
MKDLLKYLHFSSVTFLVILADHSSSARRNKDVKEPSEFLKKMRQNTVHSYGSTSLNLLQYWYWLPIGVLAVSRRA